MDNFYRIFYEGKFSPVLDVDSKYQKFQVNREVKNLVDDVKTYS